MGKVDDMRRRREAQHQARSASAPRVTPADEGAGPARDDAASGEDEPSPAAAATEADSGVCSGCGKVKPMQRGLIINHQKGLGKYCVGSRKPPA